jgi:hypothetical protein
MAAAIQNFVITQDGFACDIYGGLSRQLHHG